MESADLEVYERQLPPNVRIRHGPDMGLQERPVTLLPQGRGAITSD